MQNQKNLKAKKFGYLLLTITTALLVLMPSISFAMGAFDKAIGFTDYLIIMCYLFSPSLFLLTMGTSLLCGSWFCMKRCMPKKGWLV